MSNFSCPLPQGLIQSFLENLAFCCHPVSSGLRLRTESAWHSCPQAPSPHLSALADVVEVSRLAEEEEEEEAKRAEARILFPTQMAILDGKSLTELSECSRARAPTSLPSMEDFSSFLEDYTAAHQTGIAFCNAKACRNGCGGTGPVVYRWIWSSGVN
jgi:hypothetical protein